MIELSGGALITWLVIKFVANYLGSRPRPQP